MMEHLGRPAGFRVEVREPSDSDAPCHHYNHKGTD